MDIGSLLLGILVGSLIVWFIYLHKLDQAKKKVNGKDCDIDWWKAKYEKLLKNYTEAAQNTFEAKLFSLQNLVKLRTYRETLKSINGVKSCLVMYIFDNFIEYHWSNAIPNLDLKREAYSLNLQQLQELTAAEVSLAHVYKINLQNAVDCKPNQEKED